MAVQFNRERFEALVLWIAHETKNDRSFGRTKLAKVLFYCDFDAYREVGAPLTGATYRRWKYGPFPPVLQSIEERLEAQGDVRLEYDVPEGEEKKIVPVAPRPDVSAFLQPWQIDTMRSYIRRFREQSAVYVSDQSHQHPGWRLVGENKPIPYDTSFLASGPPGPVQAERAKEIAREQGWLTEDGWVWERGPA